MTNDLIRRVYEHKNGIIQGFTWEHQIHQLVYCEVHEDVYEAIRREKLIKKGRRAIKLEAIERMNPDWKDLYYDLIGEPQECHPVE